MTGFQSGRAVPIVRAGSGGGGAKQGGMGQVVSFKSRWPGRLRVSLLTDRTRVPAKGIMGGDAGRPGHVYLNGVAVDNPKSVVEMHEGDTLELGLPGGGGYGQYGGSGAGATGSKSGSFVAVNAGGQTGQATYFSVCQGSDEQAVRQCSDNADNNNGGN